MGGDVWSRIEEGFGALGCEFEGGLDGMRGGLTNGWRK